MTPSRLRSDAGDVAWWVLAGAAAGAVAGLVVGGIGGRLAMLLLRLTSPELVLGIESDDGFEIGVVTVDTVQLLLAMAVLGGINGVLYAAVRGVLPPWSRLPLWTAFAALAGGATVIHEDGIDFTLVEPVELSIALFVLLPALAAAVVVLLVERLSREPAWASRRLGGAVIAGAAVGTFALVVAALVAAAALAARTAGIAPLVGRVGQVLVPVGLVVLGARFGWELVTESARLVD